MKAFCECCDPGCRSCFGHCHLRATQELVRIDMDPGLIHFCDGCTDDALESGIFALAEEAAA